jgi:hypothetical protein
LSPVIPSIQLSTTASKASKHRLASALLFPFELSLAPRARASKMYKLDIRP